MFLKIIFPDASQISPLSLSPATMVYAYRHEYCIYKKYLQFVAVTCAGPGPGGPRAPPLTPGTPPLG